MDVEITLAMEKLDKGATLKLQSDIINLHKFISQSIKLSYRMHMSTVYMISI